MTESEEELRKRVGEPGQTVSVVLRIGDTFWNLAQCKYNGSHPIDAIYAVNNLQPRFEEGDCSRGFSDPIYYAGMHYILPSVHDVPALQEKFWQGFDPRTIAERVGSAHERTAVCIRWDETFCQLSAIKYEGRTPVHAIFQLNELPPIVNTINGEKHVLEPIYHAGRSYLFPAEHEISQLLQRYESQINSLIR